MADKAASPGVMHEIDQAFYDLAIKERDYERRRVARLEKEVAMLRNAPAGSTELLSQKLKAALVKNLLGQQVKELDAPYMTVKRAGGADTYTLRELAEEIDKESKEGMDMLVMFLTTAADMARRNKA
jgi:arginyl-tRNA synthetase